MVDSNRIISSYSKYIIVCHKPLRILRINIETSQLGLPAVFLGGGETINAIIMTLLTINMYKNKEMHRYTTQKNITLIY